MRIKEDESKGKKHRQKNRDEVIILWQYSLGLLKTCLRVSKQMHQSHVQEHTASAFQTTAGLPVSQQHDRLGCASEAFVAEFNYVHRQPASASSAVQNRRVIKKRISSQDHQRYRKAPDTSETSVPQVITEWKTRQTSTIYFTLSVLHRRHSSTNTLSFFEVIPQLLHIALTWSMIYLKPSANNFFSPVRSHVWTAFLPSSLSASKSPRNMYSSGNCTWRDVHCMSAKFAHRQGGLNWESLTQRRETARLCALFKTYKGKGRG